jgi:hypothetical protein
LLLLIRIRKRKRETRKREKRKRRRDEMKRKRENRNRQSRWKVVLRSLHVKVSKWNKLARESQFMSETNAMKLVFATIVSIPSRVPDRS